MFHYTKINVDRIRESFFPKLTSQSKNCVLLHCFPNSLSKENINKVLTDYDVRQSYKYKCGNDFGVAFLYQSDMVKGLREVKEICLDRSGNIAKEGKISLWQSRCKDARYCQCSDKEKVSFSGIELMKGLLFSSLPCPFGLHLINEKPISIIRVLDNELSVLIAAAYDSSSVYISANEEQLGGEIASARLTGRSLVYYPKYGEYENALKMKAKLAEKNVVVGVSPFMENVSFVGKKVGCDISDYIRTEMSTGKTCLEVMKCIFTVDPELTSSGQALW